MSGISNWLAAQGFERYATAFENAEIDVATLELLTDDDLRELGVPLGPRRKILAARDTPSSADADRSSAGERRQITVMFVDLVGSTSLSTRIDPELMGELLSDYKAREDAAECAIRCAFQVRDRIKQILDPAGGPLQCRTGIATGLVVVGGTTGKGNAREESIAGEVLNLAARLQALAEPDGICVSARVREQVGQLFEFDFAGEHELRGFDSLVAAWRPVREAGHTNRYAATKGIKRTLVGRADELAMLAAQWAKVTQGDGRAALILGEAGIGKSRLIEEVRELVGETPHALASWQCSAFHQMKPLYPIIERITRASEISDDDDGPTRFGKLKVLLSAADMPESALPLFAGLLSIPEAAGYSMPDLTPAQRRSATIAAIGDWIRRIAEEKPLLLILEDAHWGDATTLEVINLLINGLSGVSIMALVTGRPEFAAPWSGRPKVTVIGLDRLNDRECEGIIREIVPRDEVAAGAIKQILEHSDGNPLFVEELSVAFARSGANDEQVVPETLQGSLMARLDQLGDAKRTAQLCAVLGRHFARPLLLQIYDGSSAVLDTNLSLLVANDVVHPLGRANEGRYQFKHALLRDAAYESLLMSQRRLLHERCGRQLEREFPEVVESEPELLAHHFRQAGLPSEAVDYLERAGDRASASAAYIEAIASYREALQQSTKLVEGGARDNLGPALSIIDGAQAATVREVYHRAESLGRTVNDLDARFKALWGLWYNANVGRDYSRASDFAEELVLLSEQSNDDSHVLEAIHCRWSSAMFRGECTTSIVDADRGTTLYRRDRHHRLSAVFGGHDPGVCAFGVAGSSRVTAGQFTAAMRNVTDAIALAEDLRHPHSTAHALMTSLSTAATTGAYDSVRKWGEALAAVAETFNFPPQRAVAAFFLEWTRAQTGDLDLERLRSSFNTVVTIGPLTLVYIALYAEELLKAGQTEEALSIIDHFVGALKFSFGFFLPEIYRVRGECLAALGRSDEAIDQLQSAGDLAAEQGSELFALRAAVARARHCKSPEARASAIEAVKSSLAAIDTTDWPELEAAREMVIAN